MTNLNDKSTSRHNELPFHPIDSHQAIVGGVSYREWLIGMALQGLLTQPDIDSVNQRGMAITAIGYADAVIEILDEQAGAIAAQEMMKAAEAAANRNAKNAGTLKAISRE